MSEKTDISNWRSASPFWMSLLLIPFAWVGAVFGGWWVLILPIMTWHLFSIIDTFVGLSQANADPNTDDTQLVWYRWITIIWAPLQAVTLFALIWYVTQAVHLSGLEKFGLFCGMGVISGTIGINYSHELMHQKSRIERWMADILLAMVLYSHFRSEHLLVHHRYVGTPKDPVTARYNEGFHRFFWRVLRQSFWSALNAEKLLLTRGGFGFFHRKNPFLRYWGLQLFFVVLAIIFGGIQGLALFFVQALVAILQLELVNYVEHYGLTRRHLGDGKYEHVMPRHSWNAAHKASNWLLINLQRHSDHHYKPDRRYPLLQTYGNSDAPQLPFGYPIMTMLATVPPVWRRVMNPRVRAWRQTHYPDIVDWRPYNRAENPLPR